MRSSPLIWHQQEFMDQSGYIIQIRPFILSEDVSDFDYESIRREEYMVFAAEGSGERLSLAQRPPLLQLL